MDNFYGYLFDLLTKGYDKKKENPSVEVKEVVPAPQEKKEEKKIEEIVPQKIDKPKEVMFKDADFLPEMMDDVVEGVIWSEVLGPPKCRRRSHYR